MIFQKFFEQTFLNDLVFFSQTDLFLIVAEDRIRIGEILFYVDLTVVVTYLQPRFRGGESGVRQKI